MSHPVEQAPQAGASRDTEQERQRKRLARLFIHHTLYRRGRRRGAAPDVNSGATDGVESLRAMDQPSKSTVDNSHVSFQDEPIDSIEALEDDRGRSRFLRRSLRRMMDKMLGDRGSESVTRNDLPGTH